ncbi:hypothetical protein AgCh_031190 [Apium graveolens]
MNGTVELHFFPSEKQLADIFTKLLDESTFSRLHRRGGAIAPENQLAIVVRGSVTSLWSLLTKQVSRTFRKFSTGHSSPKMLMSTINYKTINFWRKKRVSGEEVDGEEVDDF